MSPVAAIGYWQMRRAQRRPVRNVLITLGGLACVATVVIACEWFVARDVLSHPEAFSVPRGDLFRYSAKWWGYLVPPVAHPWLGGMSLHIWLTAGIRDGLLEQQVSVGWAVIALAAVAEQGGQLNREHSFNTTLSRCTLMCPL